MGGGESTAGGRERETDSARSIDPGDLDGFLDAFMADAREEWRIPGIAFALVQRGQVPAKRGFGVAIRESRRPVDPDQTILRAGSISKLITATAAMQLHERGLWDLQDDVNHHLTALQVRNPYPRPVSVGDLLTHSSGLDDTFLGQHVKHPADLEPLGPYLARRLPPVNRPPGMFFRYSDHGASLLGHLVEEVAGVSFNRYTEDNIFRPLGMKRTTFRQPPRDAWMPELAVGYRVVRGGYRPYRLDYVFTTPAAGLYTTASDMTRFMLAHLQGGTVDGTRILEATTVADMHRRHFAHHPQLRGRAYGFSEWMENGQRALFHDGSMPGFNSRLLLLPDHHVGFFLTWNSTSMGLKHAWTTQFLDRYFPEGETEKARPERRSPSPGRARRFAGEYRDNLYSGRTIEKVVALSERVRVHEDEGETLRVGSTRLAEVEDGLFESLEGDGRIAFRQEGGKVTHLFIGTGAFERVPWWESRAFTLGFVGLSALVFFWSLLAALLSLAGVLSMGVPPPLLNLLALAGGLHLLFLLGLVRGLPRVDIWAYAYGIPPPVKAMLLVPLGAAALAITLIGLGIGLWTDPVWTLLGRVHFALVLGTGLAQLPWLNAWNLLGFRDG
ncbi:MAG: serine hydrolase domain-containing protein [Thermoplasmata archaeon]